MRVIHLNAGRQIFACAALAVILSSGLATAADQFPFDQELLLDAAPMRPAKRMPILTVEPNGNAKIDLWCRTVPARVEISDATIKIEAGPLPEDLPAMQSAGQCTPERMQADEEMLAALVQVTSWRREGESVVLEGSRELKFRTSDH
ncbi:MAG TPA: META domain-containing protein [Pseudolabrys sp.]|nr:META domain-containing protein [Pseudolabrys sp.]